jgi:hypothetical protein
MKTSSGVEVQLHAFLNSVLDGGEWLASQPLRFIPEEREAIGEHITSNSRNSHVCITITPDMKEII